jgi:hypothetical protein
VAAFLEAAFLVVEPFLLHLVASWQLAMLVLALGEFLEAALVG